MLLVPFHIPQAPSDAQSADRHDITEEEDFKSMVCVDREAEGGPRDL